MDLLLIALLLAAVGAVVVVAIGKVGGGLGPVQPDAAPALEGPVSRPGDLDRARFGLALRGYRMDQVDAVLDEARDLMAARDEEIARLHRLLPVERRPAQPWTVARDAAPHVERSEASPGSHEPHGSYESFEPAQPDASPRRETRS